MDIEQFCVSIIAYAGDSQSSSQEAIRYAKENNFEESERLLKKAKEAALESHNFHTQLLVQSANNAQMNVNFLMVHASNHLSVAEMLIVMAEMYIDLKRSESKR